jgi:hypothetical protein
MDWHGTEEIKKLKAEIERLRAVLEWLQSRGGLGLDVHERIDKALANKERK